VIYCNNPGCRFCAIDTEAADGGVMVCTVDPIMINVESLKPWMMKCNNYKYRPVGEKIQPLCPSVGKDGLYPGQIKPPTDYSDYDPAEETGEKECDT